MAACRQAKVDLDNILLLQAFMKVYYKAIYFITGISSMSNNDDAGKDVVRCCRKSNPVLYTYRSRWSVSVSRMNSLD